MEKCKDCKYYGDGDCCTHFDLSRCVFRAIDCEAYETKHHSADDSKKVKDAVNHPNQWNGSNRR